MNISEPKKRPRDYSKILFSIAGVIVIAGMIFGSSIYASKVMNPTELVHFFIPFPAGKITRPMTVSKPDGGKIFTRPITIDVEARGILKKIINPNVEGLSTHWLTNIDSKPHRIGLKFTDVNVPMKWEVGSRIPWDEATKTFTDPVGPGESIADLGVDWFFYFTPEIMAKAVWYEGNLVVFDVDTGESLTSIPIKFQRGTVNEKTGWGDKKT